MECACLRGRPRWHQIRRQPRVAAAVVHPRAPGINIHGKGVTVSRAKTSRDGICLTRAVPKRTVVTQVIKMAVGGHRQ